MPIVSRGTIKSDWLNIPSADTTHDALIDRFIESVSAEIEGICNQPIEQASTTWYFTGAPMRVYGNATSFILLPWTSPATLTSVASRQLPADSWVSGTGYHIVNEQGKQSLWTSGSYSAPFYRLIADVGYASIPDDIALCAYEMVKELYYETPFAAEAERFGVSAVSETDAGISISKAILSMRERVKPRLAKYIAYGI